MIRDKPRGEALRVVLEIVAGAGQVGISIAVMATGAWRKEAMIAATSTLALWSYVLVLCAARLTSTLSPRVSFPTIWFHTSFLYGVTWIPAALLLRSYILHPPSPLARELMIASFVLNTFLLGTALASRKCNKPVELEYEQGIPPSREPTASIISLATFSWVDAIVWQGYKKTFELEDVWNLAPKDKAAVILAHYRQMKKTSDLAWHLLRHFRQGLLEQAAWACLSGFLTFAPTLLLRFILLYVENPEDTPRDAAWFFVILLFVSGCASALSDGMALWIGRKLCIRLRAVIIGELYAKALKRKVGVAAESVLGEKLQDASKDQRPWWKRWFIRQSKEDQDTQQQQQQKQQLRETNDGDDASQVSSGAIINLMAVDSFKVSEISAYLHFLWASTPIQIIVAVVLLYQLLGLSSIAGIVAMIVLLPVNMIIAKRFASVQKKILAATDARIHTTNEVLTNIRIIKYFAWEQRFLGHVDAKRQVELMHLRSRYILWSLAATVWGGAPVLITFLSFAIYTLVEKKDLVPSIAFTALSLFQILRIPLDQLADMVAHVQESKVSVDRIDEFLHDEDTEKYQQLRHCETENGKAVLGFDHASFTWGGRRTLLDTEQSDGFRLMDLDLRFKAGELNVISGATGSGKSSLLLALLGEMTCLEGRVHLPGGRSREDVAKDPVTGLAECVAYCAQQAWLVNATVKENIVFASPWDAARYNQVVTACSLRKDFEILDHGDNTAVGEKGVTLSGGQKQRISLARALYSNAKHVLLDDILSAVDAHTSKWIFEKALAGPLMKNRTCILVTHNVALCLPKAAFAVVLENGRMTASGSAQDVILSGRLSEDLTKSTTASTRNSSHESSPTLTPEDDDTAPEGETNGLAANGTAHDTPVTGPTKAAASQSPAMTEGKAEGSVKLSLILTYFRQMGPWWYWAIAAFTFILQQLSNVSTNVWVRQWANAYNHRSTSGFATRSLRNESTHPLWMNMTSHEHEFAWARCIQSWSCLSTMPASAASDTYAALASHTVVDAGYYLSVYALLGLLYMLITFLREGVLFAGSLNASRKIHKELMERVSHAKFRFFDSTPLGQLMNRFSKDIENIDQEIAPVAVGVVHCMASIFTIVILISVITPGFLIAGLFITFIYFFIGYFYIRSSRDLKRIESVQRSPLYQQFGETLSGMTTIRAYGDERRFIRDNLNRVNTHNRPFLYLWAANRWLAFRVDVAGALVSFSTGVFVILSVGSIDAGAAGLAMTYAVTFTENVLWFVRLYASNEQNMNSVERIKEYLDVEQEAPSVVEGSRPDGNWPSQGAVEFINYSTRYRKEFDPVLRGLTFKIQPCEKIGVVGRTGAGKSSMALALFRALEADDGKILIDDVDIGLIGLQDLRESIVMVPQDPTLFTGTIRSNLDPFGLFTDEEIFTALRRVQLVGSSNITSAVPSRPQTPAKHLTHSHPGVNDASATSRADSIGTPGTPTSGANRNIFLNLHSSVSESGGNLSQGQRQLLCLARALLKSPKVLLMDEATASIDYATDSKIQDTIRELRGNTIITIAHRLKTIVDYDRVVVLERGRVVEMGVPWQLLSDEEVDEATRGPQGTRIKDPSGKRWFREMCETSGELETLMHEAKRSWESKRLVDDS